MVGRDDDGGNGSQPVVVPSVEHEHSVAPGRVGRRTDGGAGMRSRAVFSSLVVSVDAGAVTSKGRSGLKVALPLLRGWDGNVGG
jgi:hypothetical protein